MKRFFFIAASIMLASCAYSLEGSLQEITFKTPGAENAVCHLYEGVKKVIRPPQTIVVKKSGKTLKLECMAPGNRDQTVYIKPETIDAIMLNIGNALVPGLATDYATGAMFMYPEVVIVDFTGIRPEPMPLPAYHAPDTLPPVRRGMEEFRPSHPELSTDRTMPGPARRDGYEEEEGASSEAGTGKITAGELTEEYNPHVFQDTLNKLTRTPGKENSADNVGAPVQLAPR